MVTVSGSRASDQTREMTWHLAERALPATSGAKPPREPVMRRRCRQSSASDVVTGATHAASPEHVGAKMPRVVPLYAPTGATMLRPRPTVLRPRPCSAHPARQQPKNAAWLRPS